METHSLKFWMVYGLHQRGPVFRHKSQGSALDEAKRLSRSHPGIEFFVLEATHHVVKRDVDVTEIGHVSASDFDDGVPF